MNTRTALVAALAAAFALSACSSNPETNRNIALGTAAIAAVGAGAYLLNKHDHKNNDSHDEVYRQGYDDARNGNGVHSNDQAYMDGYREGKQARHEAEPERYGRSVNVSDIEGMRASYGEQELRSRGFQNVSGGKSWNRGYASWWNDRANECVRVTTQDGRYEHVDVVAPGSCR
ncbi:hypothetical protein ACFONG_02195 [Uliginosibacterium paludis]|uniref:Uncharacterized protein n=1 Tax=Uliginosibacterium paludis TaxID=1615952 RepID=A0ABV2CSZ1_9RHOO